VADNGGRAIDLKSEEWMSWHMEQGHDYYKRRPTKPNHLKGLTRLNAYVLIRIRLGMDQAGHEACVG